MRTYTRKKSVHLIEGVQDLCRLCLQNSNSSVPIFENETESIVCAPLPLRIMICVGLEMSNDKQLPNKICIDCFKELERCYSFRKKCELAYQRLKSHLLAVKQQQRSQDNEMRLLDSSNSTSLHESALQGLVLSVNNEEQVEVENISSVLEENQVQNEAAIECEETTIAKDPTESDMTMILSTILKELGVLQESDIGLVKVDDTLTTMEIEGEGGSKVVLELVEEEEEAVTNSQESVANNQITSQVKPKNGVVKKVSNEKQCPRCGKWFASVSAARRHARAHSGERPHACARCPLRFAQRAVRTRHELLHQAQRPFPCAQCPAAFTQRGALSAHARVHSNAIALHRCPVCGKTFLHASGVSRHMAVHTGKVFECAMCARRFRDKSSLLRHLRRTHPSHAPPEAAINTDNV